MNQETNDSTQLKPTTVIALSFLLLGFLIGNLIGLSKESIVASFIPLLFAFAGGSAIAFSSKVDEIEQVKSAVAIAFLSVGCVVGIYMGILLTEHQILTPEKLRSAKINSEIEDRKYLRTNLLRQANAIDQQLRSDLINHEKAYEKLFETIEQINDD